MIESAAESTTRPWAQTVMVPPKGPRLEAGNISMVLETRDVTLADLGLEGRAAFEVDGKRQAKAFGFGDDVATLNLDRRAARF